MELKRHSADKIKPPFFAAADTIRPLSARHLTPRLHRCRHLIPLEHLLADTPHSLAHHRCYNLLAPATQSVLLSFLGHPKYNDIDKRHPVALHVIHLRREELRGRRAPPAPRAPRCVHRAPPPPSRSRTRGGSGIG